MDTERRSCASGFSLVEILVVLAIVALMTAIALPALRGANAENRLSRSTATTLRQYLRSARTYAIENRVKTAICYVYEQRNIDDEDSSRWNGYIMMYKDRDHGWRQLHGGPLQDWVVLNHVMYMRPGRFVDGVTTNVPQEILDAFANNPQGLTPGSVRGYSAFRPSGTGTVCVEGEWIPLTGQSEMRVYDDRLGETTYMVVRVVNATGNVKIDRIETS